MTTIRDLPEITDWTDLRLDPTDDFFLLDYQGSSYKISTANFWRWAVGQFGFDSAVVELDNIDLTTNNPGFWRATNNTAGTKPSGVSDFGLVRIIRHNIVSGSIHQEYFDVENESIYKRFYNNSSWGNWHQYPLEETHNGLVTTNKSPTGRMEIVHRGLTLSYYSSIFLLGNYSFPEPFLEPPSVTVNFMGSAENVTPSITEILAPFPRVATEFSTQIRTYRQAGATDFQSGDNITVQMHVIGRWK